MKPFLWNILLALSWAALSGDFAPRTFVTGFVIGYAVLWISRNGRHQRYFTTSRRSVTFTLFVLWELVLSSLKVAHDVLSPKLRNKPGIVAVPLDTRSDAEILVMANAITLTPGTMSVDVSEDRRTLYVHAMFVGDPAEFRKGIKSEFERRTMELMR